jgi:ankyrin repeat protein
MHLQRFERGDVQSYIREGGSVNAPFLHTCEDGIQQEVTLLVALCKKNYTTAVRNLIEAGADINLELPGSHSCTPLVQCILSKNAELVRLLIRRGAAMTSRQTPLSIAAAEGDVAIMRLFVSAGAA